MTKINLNEVSGTRTVHFEDTHIDDHEGGVVPISHLVIGDYTGTGATMIKWGREITMTRLQYNNIVTFKGESITYDADTEIEFPETNAQLKADIQNLGSHHVDFIERFEALEEAKEPVIYKKWTLRGTTLQGTTGERNRHTCNINMLTFYNMCQEPIDPTDVDGNEFYMTILTPAGDFVFHTHSAGEIGRITDGVIANSSVPVESTPPRA